MKPFTTYDEQINLLKSRGLTINDVKYAKSFLEKEGYFNVINGFKDAFLENRENEHYKKTAKFEDIANLYLFDRNLKHRILTFALIVENTIKTIVAYEFAQTYGSNGYLNHNNYNIKYAKEVSRLMLTFQKCIEKDSLKEEKQFACLRHYKENHQYIPIWVLFNYLTFGNVSSFYSCLKKDTKISIANHISSVFNFNLNTKDLYTCIRILNNLRNMCAHNQRIYDYSTKFTFSNNSDLIIDIKAIGSSCLHRIDVVLLLMKIFSNEVDFISYLEEINYLLDRVSSLFKIDAQLINILLSYKKS